MKAINAHEHGSRKILFPCLFSIAIVFVAVSAQAAKPGSGDQPPGQEGTIDLSGGYITNMGFINAADQGVEFTNSSIRTMAVSIGQLGGVNPETGEVIMDAGNLLPMVSKELDVTGKAFFYTNVYVAGDTYVYGAFFGSGAGLTNLPAQNISGSLTARPEIQSALNTKLDAAGVWETINQSTATITDLQNLIDALDASIEATNNPHHVTAVQVGALPVTGGTLSGHLNMNGIARIINLPEPANDQDAVSKLYLERRLSYIPPQGDIGMGIYTNAP